MYERRYATKLARHGSATDVNVNILLQAGFARVNKAGQERAALEAHTIGVSGDIPQRPVAEKRQNLFEWFSTTNRERKLINFSEWAYRKSCIFDDRDH